METSKLPFVVPLRVTVCAFCCTPSTYRLTVFEVSMTGLSVGRHTAPLVAEMETDDLTLKRESIHIELCIRDR